MEKQTKPQTAVTIRSSAAEYLTYIASTGTGDTTLELRYEDENIWITQKRMSVLYDVDVTTINHHIKKILDDSELEERATIAKFAIVQTEGNRQVSREVNHYGLDMIIAVGFKVNSERAVQFRKWVNGIAREYTIKGWVMDDARIKRGTYLTDNTDTPPQNSSWIVPTTPKTIWDSLLGKMHLPAKSENPMSS